MVVKLQIDAKMSVYEKQNFKKLYVWILKWLKSYSHCVMKQHQN